MAILKRKLDQEELKKRLLEKGQAPAQALGTAVKSARVETEEERQKRRAGLLG